MWRRDLLPVDLLIRTGGERRISNFHLWDVAYAELYFCDDFWPDFSEQRFREALADYASRERRYGRTSEQVSR
jgi:undecaprenyl diphosphate synthase